ncbi:tetratricopeptide repeat protein [Candidatus Nitrosacidococcus sp. I8]|uniref:tetratricopeptide repeat protein n=1 Tax=Candidatus Nitrosacidococcus sp. I8 TaxID=2942908 RepID=UPI00222605AF|nr:tetratricopeptide repeat protein [Candidatus Nitrosacidococcus sp. I8]CAH9017921.1 Secretory immunoglobulin A-binding protein EsiB [Candidatus Nitrosacidococcus sp. I8]
MYQAIKFSTHQKIIFLILFLSLFSFAQADEQEPTYEFKDLSPIEKKEDPQISAHLDLGRKAYKSQDYNTALKELKPLAEKGNKNAQYYMGLMYANGHGLPLDTKKAEQWFDKFVQQIGMDGKFNLGVMYYQGSGVPQNYEIAINWFKKAAKDGDYEAQFNLGYFYENGYGAEEDLKEAIKWYQEAANHGLAQAQIKLGEFYSDGYGVAQNNVQAYFWLSLAAEQGNKEATEFRDSIAKEMTKKQIDEAIALTKQWSPTSLPMK